MPLLDHFHPPLYPHRSWESVHGAWAVGLISALNQGGLPPEYFAEAQTHVGSRVEVDVGTFHDEPRASRARRSDEGGIAVAEPPRWVAPAAVMSVPITYPDSVEALIYSSATGKNSSNLLGIQILILRVKKLCPWQNIQCFLKILSLRLRRVLKIL